MKPKKRRTQKNLLTSIEKVLSENEVVLENKAEKDIIKAVKQVAKKTIYRNKLVKRKKIKDAVATDLLC